MKNYLNPASFLIIVALLLCSASFALLFPQDEKPILNQNEKETQKAEIQHNSPQINPEPFEIHILDQDTIDALRDNIIDFSEKYKPFTNSYTYFGWQPIFASWFSSDQTQYFNFYVADKDISKLSRCNTTNYLIALKAIDKVLLKPWETFNANKNLAQKTWYCTGRWEANFLFYGGVCWMVSQLFRTSLINPAIQITQRHAHSEWFVQYYWEDYGWDDAAVYQMNKQFEIKNISDQDIYFRSLQIWDMTYLVAITPKTEKGNPVQITKAQPLKNKIELTRTIGTWNELFTSVYTNKNHELR